jgi:hypothetical protein
MASWQAVEKLGNDYGTFGLDRPITHGEIVIPSPARNDKIKDVSQRHAEGPIKSKMTWRPTTPIPNDQ